MATCVDGRTSTRVVVLRRKTLQLSAILKYDVNYMDTCVAVRVRVVLPIDAEKSRNVAVRDNHAHERA